MKKKNEMGRYNVLFLLLLALIVSNIFLLGSYFLLGIALLYMLLKQKIIICFKSVILILFSFSYLIFSCIFGEVSFGAFKPLIYIAAWMMIYDISKNKSIEQIFLFISFLAFGMSFHGFINYGYNLLRGINLRDGVSYDAWSKSYSAATGQAINFTLFISIAFWMIFYQKNFFLKFLGVFCFIVALLYDIQLGGRTFLILVALSSCSNIILYIFYNLFRRTDFKKVIIILLSSIIIILLGVVLFNNNVFGIKNFFEGSYFYKRVFSSNGTSMFNDGRIEKKIKYWEIFFDYPFGGNKISQIENISYAHELWLDVFDDAGIIAYFFICLYTLSVLFTIIGIVKKCKIHYLNKISLFVFLLVIYAQFFVEPILSGAPMLFASFVMIDAALTSFYDNCKNI